MSATIKRTFSLLQHQADLIDRKVWRGEFVSQDEVISAALTALAEADARMERWLREEVVPVVEEMKAHPDRGIPAEIVFSELRQRYQAE